MSTSKDISGHKMCPLGVKLISSIRKFHFYIFAVELKNFFFVYSFELWMPNFVCQSIISMHIFICTTH